MVRRLEGVLCSNVEIADAAFGAIMKMSTVVHSQSNKLLTMSKLSRWN